MFFNLCHTVPGLEICDFFWKHWACLFISSMTLSFTFFFFFFFFFFFILVDWLCAEIKLIYNLIIVIIII